MKTGKVLIEVGSQMHQIVTQILYNQEIYSFLHTMGLWIFLSNQEFHKGVRSLQN